MSTTGDDGEELGDDDAPCRLIRNTKSRRKLVAQVRRNMPERAVCDVETGVGWWLEESDHHCTVMSSRR